MLLRFRYALLCLLLTAAPLGAQTVIAAGSDLRQAIPPGTASYTLSPGTYSTALRISGGEVEITAAGAEFGGVEGQSILLIDADAALTLSGATLTTTNPEQAAIFLNGGSLTLTDVTFDGPFQFGIYAAAGSTLTVNNATFTAPANGIYLLDKVAFDITGAQFSGASSLAIAAIGAEVTGTITDLDVTGPTADMGVMSRQGASLTVTDARLTGLSGRALYADGGASLTARDVTMTDVAEGGGFFDVGRVEIANATIGGTSGAGISMQGGDSLRLTNVTADVQGTALSTSGQIAEVEVQASTFQTANPERATIFLTHAGAYALFDVTGTGGYAGLYVKGPRGDISNVTESRFTSSGFAAVVVQDSNTTGWDAPSFDEVILHGQGDAAALALDSTADVTLVRSELYSTAKAPLSLYESQALSISESILAGAADSWALGTVSSNVEDTVSANVIRTGIDFAATDFAALQAQLRAEKGAAQEAAMQLGQVAAVNTQGMPIFGNAASIQLVPGQGDDPYHLPPTGERVDIPAGSYTLVIDGRDLGPLTVTPDTLQEIEVPDPVHPYFIKFDGEKFLRGAPLILRPRDELAANWRARGVNVLEPRLWSALGYAPRRPELSDTEAAEVLTETRRAYYDNTPRAHQGYRNGNKEYEDRLAQVRQFLLGPIMAELGTAEDVPRILATLPDDATAHRSQAMEHAAMIAARTGTLAGQPLLTKAQTVLATNPRMALDLATISGVMGNADAVAMVLDLLTGPQVADRDWRQALLSLELISRSSDPRVLALFRQVLDDFGTAWEQAFATGKDIDWYTPSGFPRHAIPLALEYVAAHGDDSDAARMVLPLTARDTMDTSIMGLLASPIDAYMDNIGLRDIPINGFFAPDVIRMGHLICRAVERRSATERDQFLSQIEVFSGKTFNDLYFNIQYDGGDHYVGKKINRITAAYCNPNTDVAGHRRSDPRGLDLYSEDIIAHAYDDRPILAENEIARFDADKPLWPRPELYSQMPKDEVLARMDADPRFATPLGQTLRLNVRALDYRYLEKTPDVYSNGADRRVFNTGLAASNDEAVLSGRVDLRPILSDGTLRVGLRLQIAYSESGFLTPQITRRDVMLAEALKNGALGMITSVRLLTPDGPQEMPRDQTTNSGVHIYALPYASNDPSGLRVEVTLHVFEQTWVFPFPLSYGEFAFRQRSMLP